MIYHAREYHF